MSPKPFPHPSIFDQLEFARTEAGRKVFRSSDRKRQYTWDSQHGEVEVFDKQGRHLGVADPTTGRMIKPAKRGRRISKLN